MRQSSADQSAKRHGLVLEQLSSGQSVAEFCRDRGIRASQFYDWKKRIREGEAPKFVEVKVKESSAQRKPAPECSRAIAIRLNNGRSLLVEPRFDASHLRALLAVLESEL
jgi:transposase-like protein